MTEDKAVEWVLVPKEATGEMARASEWCSLNIAHHTWDPMIAARPPIPAAEVERLAKRLYRDARPNSPWHTTVRTKDIFRERARKVIRYFGGTLESDRESI